MGKADNQKTRDKNKAKLPQTPGKDIVQGAREDTEFANELNDRYELERKPGFAATGVKRKKK
jgi:hypothetical protein